MGFPLLSSTWSLRWAFSRLPGYCQQDNRSVRGSGELFQMPELLRVKGALLRFFASSLLRSMQSGYDKAERCFRESLDLARIQGAGWYELRRATDLAALLAD